MVMIYLFPEAIIRGTPRKKHCKIEFQKSYNRPYARETKLAEFDIKKLGLKSYPENVTGKPGNPRV
jgi:hypothetical protein